MERVKTKSYRDISIFLASISILAGGLYSTTAKANNPTQLAGQQLAYYVGYHSSTGNVYRGPGYVYYGPRYRYYSNPRRLYWTGWRFVNCYCQRNCLIEHWSGRVVRCESSCRQ